MFLLSKQIIYRYIMNFGLTEHPLIKLKLFNFMKYNFRLLLRIN